MKNATHKSRLLFTGILLCIVVGTSAWQLADKKAPAGSQTNTGTENGDTTKSRKHSTDRDAYRMSELDDAMHELDIQMDKLNIELKNINTEAIEKEVKEALSKVDFSKINADVTASLKAVDWDKINHQIEKSLKEAQKEMQQVKLDEIQTHLQDVQAKLNSDAFRVKIDSKKIHEQIDAGMKQARAGIERAKERIQRFRSLAGALEKDGLLDTKKGYRIELSDGDLYINGKKQPEEITRKYSKYYDGEKHFVIRNDGDNTWSF